MFEKIKDFLYDISDIVVSLLIIGVIFLAVSWKISDTLSVDIETNDAKKTTTEASTDSTSIVITPVDSSDTSSETTTEATSSDPASQPTTQPVTQPATQPATQPVTQPATQPTTQANATLEKFVVSEGELGNTIGKNLQAQGFVKSSDAFVKRLIEMGYDSKLKAGTFKISKSYDLDTIIKILAGKN